ncbi:hypothetical protein BS50DRAFT_658099 [Corynespora cassiicola Philippines]|uniref:Uncharacterized protein n=1 Tax=Corynespora cassiicola Philippines TaxID=1448308 RepID=A0A2T2P3N6_CORCC|nr:hypothetical protein BS50DRAFT_658099 [Corynespora cassiicola Philippines]
MPKNMTDDLLKQIDEHLTDTATKEQDARFQGLLRRGTMFVDWDGSGQPIISYRNSLRGETGLTSVSAGHANSTLQSIGTIEGFSSNAAFRVRYPDGPYPDHPSKPTYQEVLSLPSYPYNGPRLPYPDDQSTPPYPDDTSDLPYPDDMSDPPYPDSPPTHILKHHSENDLLIVDNGTLRIKYSARPSSTRLGEVDDSLHIEGFDPVTEFDYDYDGRIVHVHRQARRGSCAVSEYWAIEAGEWGRGVEVEVFGCRERVTEKIVGFIMGLMGRLEGMGVLRRLAKWNRRG